MLMEDVERGDEELVRVLLFVARQVACVRPHQVQQSVRCVWCAHPTVELQQPHTYHMHIRPKLFLMCSDRIKNSKYAMICCL